MNVDCGVTDILSGGILVVPKLPTSNSGLEVFIPTRGRVDKQLTIAQFRLDSIGYTPVVPKCEVTGWTGRPIYIVPDEYKFSDVRQFILRSPGKYHVVIDDDLYLAVRRSDDPTKFTNISELSDSGVIEHVRRLFDQILDVLKAGWIHGGVAARQGANYSRDKYSMASREMRFHFYNAEVVRKLGYDFRRVVIKQDLDFTLWMLRHGIPNIIINDYVQEQTGNNAEGGCSRYRTFETLKEGAVRLAELHPEFVKVVEKHPKRAWGGQPRVDVNVQWKKAYKAGLRYIASLKEKDQDSLTEIEKTCLEAQL